MCVIVCVCVCVCVIVLCVCVCVRESVKTLAPCQPELTHMMFTYDLQNICMCVCVCVCVSIRRYGASPALYRVGGKPLFYVYDSYHIDKTHWATLLTKGGAHTVRGTALDGVFLGLWLDRVHGADLKEGGFDGFYTYVCCPVVIWRAGGGAVVCVGMQV